MGTQSQAKERMSISSGKIKELLANHFKRCPQLQEESDGEQNILLIYYKSYICI